MSVVVPTSASPARGLHVWHTQPTNGPPTTVVPNPSREYIDITRPRKDWWDSACMCEFATEPLSDDMKYLAGLQHIQYVFVYPELGDIVLAGPGEGWKINQAAVGVVFSSGDAMEGPIAFAEKRPPNWQGK